MFLKVIVVQAVGKIGNGEVETVNGFLYLVRNLVNISVEDTITLTSPSCLQFYPSLSCSGLLR